MNRFHDRSFLMLLGVMLLLFFIVGGWLGFGLSNNGSGVAMDSLELEARGKREIIQLHRFFQDWYRGRLDDDQFSRFDRALDRDFSIIMPDARVLERPDIIQAVRGQKASDEHAVLEIRNATLRHARDGVAVFTYEEWQGRQGEAPRGRLSTVVFASDKDAPNSLSWLHVHETWLP